MLFVTCEGKAKRQANIAVAIRVAILRCLGMK